MNDRIEELHRERQDIIDRLVENRAERERLAANKRRLGRRIEALQEQLKEDRA